MNLCDYLTKSINDEKFHDFSGDFYDLAIVRSVMKELSKLFYRDYTFFFNKENLKDRSDLYNKKFDITDIRSFAIVCKSYCNIIKDSLKQHYNIDSELISPFTDSFRHVDLLIKTKNGNQYIVDPLTDLIEMQVGSRTNNFASKTYYNNMYSGILENISFLNLVDLEKIDDTISYKNTGVYLDDFLKLVNSKLENIEELLKENKKIAIDILGKEYDGKKLSSTDKINLKLKFISKYLNNRKYLNGTVDLLMFSNTVLSNLFTEDEQEQIRVQTFFVDKQDLQDSDLKNLFTNSEDRKRGIIINHEDKNYVFSLDSKSLAYETIQWKNLIKDNNIFVKPYYPVNLLHYLKKNNANRNIVHNNEFLKLFSNFENTLLESGKSLEDIAKDNIRIVDNMIFTKDINGTISYQIENGNLLIKDYKKNLKHTVFYQDEGRDISYLTESILKDNEKVLLSEFDSNGLIDLANADGIENLVSPLSNGKYLSRNASYYQSHTYSELATERKRLGNLLTDDLSKKNFVILEYLSNSSAKVFFEELKKVIDNQTNDVTIARECFEEDCANLVRFFKNEPLQKPIYDLPEGSSKTLERHIEMDNKQFLYMFCSNLKFDKAKHVVTPGLGSIFVGPFLKSMYGFDYTNILFSLYSKDEKLRTISTQKSFEDTCSNNLWKTTKNDLILIDDNVGSCNTMNTIRNNLSECGKKCKFGAIKYNWNFYNQVKHGELDHPTYNVNDVDFLTILDDPGYWIMRDSVNALKELNGDAYVKVMKDYGLRQSNMSDIQILMNLAEKYSQSAGLNLYDKTGTSVKKSSAFLCANLKKQIKEISKQIDSQSLEEL